MDKLDEYIQRRNEFLAIEESKRIGSQLPLTPDEVRLNNWLLQVKTRDYDEGIKDPTKFLAARHFFEARPKIEQTEIYKMIKMMPKGAILHAHDWALSHMDFLFEQTYLDNLYMTESKGWMEFRFSANELKTCECKRWFLVSELRRTTHDLDGFNQRIKNALSLYVENPAKAYHSSYVIWRKFMTIFDTLISLLTYKPVHERFWHEVFNELVEDNIMYMEFRGVLPDVYDLDGTVYRGLDVVRIYKEIMEKFRETHPSFRGAKFIYSPLRNVPKETCRYYINLMKDMVREFPDFVAGFDLSGQEELGEPHIQFIEELFEVKPDVNFFFHAGETNWFGSECDTNLVDAILLETSRIGHGFALFKHPFLIERVIRTATAVETNPISNQVLGLVADLRNHPAIPFLTNEFPIVISNDDPSMWGARGLSHDFYVTFMAMMHRTADLRALKQLALNSLRFSVMTQQELDEAYAQFHQDWDIFVRNQIELRGL